MLFLRKFYLYFVLKMFFFSINNFTLLTKSILHLIKWIKNFFFFLFTEINFTIKKTNFCK